MRKKFLRAYALGSAALAVLLGGVLVLASPPVDTTSVTSPGKSVYNEKCAQCHGEDGRGDGPASAMLSPRPRDFSSGKFKFRSTESGSIPIDEDLIGAIKNGLHGTAMPDWKPFLSDDTLRTVVSYIKSFSGRFREERPIPVRVSPAVPYSSSSVAAGKRVYQKLQCGKCHGTDGSGTGAVAGDFKDDWGFEVKATNLTEPWTFRGGATTRDIYLRFRTGVDGTPMPSYKGAATETEMWNLANYVLSLARKPAWAMNEQELRSLYEAQDRQARMNPVQRGKYLVETIGCAGCHSGYTENGKIVEAFKYAGGLTFDLYPFGKYTSRNLTSDKETGLGNWTDEEILRVFNEGIRKDGRKLLPFPMPWTALAQIKEEDKRAVIAYLRTIPPVKNMIPDPEKPNIFSYLWGKFRSLVLHEQFPGPTRPMKDFQKEAAMLNRGKETER